MVSALGNEGGPAYGRGMGRYEDAFRRSLDDPAGFWAEAAAAIDWYTQPETILDDSNPPFYRWYPGGTLNTCHNAVDRHVDNGHGDQPALIYDSPVTGAKRRSRSPSCETRPPGSPACWPASASPRATASSSTCR